MIPEWFGYSEVCVHQTYCSACPVFTTTAMRVVFICDMHEKSMKVEVPLCTDHLNIHEALNQVVKEYKTDAKR